MSDDDKKNKKGGDPLIAYCKTQFTVMSEQEREFIRKAHVKYCELDTLAMVLLVGYWRDVCGVGVKAA